MMAMSSRSADCGPSRRPLLLVPLLVPFYIPGQVKELRVSNFIPMVRIFFRTNTCTIPPFKTTTPLADRLAKNKLLQIN
jgi:hypothetical protein